MAGLVGAQVRKEVEGLDLNGKQRPDLHIVFPGRVLLSDVVVSYSLTSSRTPHQRSTIAIKQGQKAKQYAHIASHLGAQLLNVSVDACGGLASDAVKLVRSDTGTRCTQSATVHLPSCWPRRLRSASIVLLLSSVI